MSPRPLFERVGVLVVSFADDASRIRSITGLGEVPVQPSFARLMLASIGWKVAVVFKSFPVDGETLVQEINLFIGKGLLASFLLGVEVSGKVSVGRADLSGAVLFSHLRAVFSSFRMTNTLSHMLLICKDLTVRRFNGDT